MAQKKIAISLLLITLIFYGRLVCAEIKQFGNLQFQLPENWSCHTEGQSMICLDGSPQSERNAALVVTYKTKSAEDTLAVYRDQLARPRILYNGEVSQPSVPKGVKEILINEHSWIEGVHYGSEMQNYITHYYATVFDQTAYLISLSIESASHTKLIETYIPTVLSFQFTKPQQLDSTSQNPSNKIAVSPPLNISQHKQKKIIQIGSHKIHLYYLLFGVGLFLVIALGIYAFFMD